MVTEFDLPNDHTVQAHTASAGTSNSCALSLLQAGVDTTVIAFWLGHAGVRSTDAYVHADMTIKEQALALTTPVTSRPGRCRPSDKILAFLDRPLIRPDQSFLPRHATLNA
ncbi:hypothetical protein [Kitasatospora sp. NPDC089509]|uniref:hypothetical protein n=1 Tax=Kitasatospora sp. NPDC089509 TaxID=3364079 RepID=UPI00382AD41F